MSADVSFPVKLTMLALLVSVGSVIFVRLVQGTPAYQAPASKSGQGIGVKSNGGQSNIRTERAPPVAVGRTHTIPADASGHYFAELQINGHSVRALVDTGATSVTIPYEEAMRLGINISPAMFIHPVSTANGRMNVAQITLNAITVGHITIPGVSAMVTPAGALKHTLLGMSFLSRAGQVEMTAQRLIIRN